MRRTMRAMAILAVVMASLPAAPAALAGAGEDATLAKRFEYLSTHGNSDCSPAFRASIETMADDARLEGSCCSPMSLHRYSEQVAGLRRFADVGDIPPDPYDIEAKLAKRLLAAYRIELDAAERSAWDDAMAQADEGGPCCCQCWRWQVYGGLGKLLIRERGYSGARVAEVWNLSDGCGGDSDHLH